MTHFNLKNLKRDRDIHGFMEKHGLFILISAIVVILDQASKAFFYSVGSFDVLPFFSITVLGNTGASFGILKGNALLLAGISFIVLFIILYLRKNIEDCRGEIPLALIFGGTFGNFIDRLLRGEVIDFLHFHYANFSFPSFNVADSCVVIGVIILVILSFSENMKNDPIHHR
ncbi:MAG: signal peptidase II [Candidatus Woesearchaeota archaeon]